MAGDDSQDRYGGDAEIARLRREVQSLRHEIAGREAEPALRPWRGMMLAGAIGACGLCGAMLSVGAAADVTATANWTTVAELVPARAAVGIVERIFTVY